MQSPTSCLTETEKGTERFARFIGSKLCKGDKLFLLGNLGAGKTALVRSILQSYFDNLNLQVPSPSYLIHFEYKASDHVVHHLDPYRLKAGVLDTLVDVPGLLESKTDILLLEWASLLSETGKVTEALEIRIKHMGQQKRELELIPRSDQWKARLEDWYLSFPSFEDAQLSAGAPDSLFLAPGPVRLILDGDPRAWIVLGIETSCDDTGVSIVRGDKTIMSARIASQNHLHSEYGGVFPNVAGEAHRQVIESVVNDCLQEASLTYDQLTAVAVTVGPGLGPCLQVGVDKALTIAAAHNLPVLRCHHMEAHTMMSRLCDPAPEFPFITVLVSGGHNLVVLSEGLGQHLIIGTSLDDSIGEAFDKTGRLLGITQVPAGPFLEKMAQKGDSNRFKLPVAFRNAQKPEDRKAASFSFSGMKNSVRLCIERLGDLSDQDKCDVAACFQKSCVEHLTRRVNNGIEIIRNLQHDGTRQDPVNVKTLVLGGGVAANALVRSEMQKVCDNAGLTLFIPPPQLCTDNGTMVAWLGLEMLGEGMYEKPPNVDRVADFNEIRPTWPLGDSHKCTVLKDRVRKGIDRQT